MNDLFAQLKHPDAAKRRDAIIALGKRRDPAAMPYLADVFRTDPDPTLRELAKKAGQHIKAGSTPSAPPVAPPPVTPPPAVIDDLDEPDLDLIVPGSAKPTAPPPAPKSGGIRALPKSDTPPSAEASQANNSWIGKPYVPGESVYIGGAIGGAAALGSDEIGYPDEIDYPDDSPLEDQVASAFGSEPPAAAKSAASENAYRGPVRGRTYDVPKADRDRAKQNVDAALSLNMNGDNDKALKTLTTALRLDPNLVNDNYFLSIAAQVTGLDGDGAIQMIVDAGQRKQFVKQQQDKKKKERVDQHLSKTSKTTSASLLMEIAIFLIISIVLPIVLLLVLRETAGNAFTQVMEQIELQNNGQVSVSTQESLEQFRVLTGINAGTLVIAALISAVVSVIGVVIQSGVTHVVAVGLLRGRGTFTHQLAEVLRVYNRWLIFIGLYSVIFIALIFVLAGSPLIACFVLPLIIMNFILFFQLVKKIGESYDIGTAMGFVAYLLATVLLSIIFGAFSALAGNLLANVLSNTLTLS
jgi:hypothetical protein